MPPLIKERLKKSCTSFKFNTQKVAPVPQNSPLKKMLGAIFIFPKIKKSISTSGNYQGNMPRGGSILGH